MTDDDANIEPVDLSPTRAELIARVRARGRQIRARRRLAITGLTALVVLAIAAPAIAIGARSGSHAVTPATVVQRQGDFRIAPIEHASSDTSQTHTSCVKYYFENSCLVLGRSIVTAADVRGASVAYDATSGWIVNVEMSRAAVTRLAAQAGRQVAIVVNDRVVSEPVITPGITGTVITVSSGATRDQAIALATEILGHAPAHVDAQPELTATVELPTTTIVSGATMQATLVIVNHSNHSVTLSTAGGCPVQWKATWTGKGLPAILTATRDGTSCTSGSTFASGTTRIPVTVTAVAFCTPRAELPNVPTCLAGGEGPPLAPGDYRVEVSGNSAAAPEPAPVPLHVVAAPPSPPSVGTLSLQTGKRSLEVLVPAGWKFTGVDAGGSGSSSTWTNPHDPNEQIEGGTGVEIGSWWETDGVAGSIHVPTGYVPAGARIQRADRTTFLYQYTVANGNVIDGVWIAELDHGQPMDYVSAQVELPASLHSTATTILNRFISDRKALYPNP